MVSGDDNFTSDVWYGHENDLIWGGLCGGYKDVYQMVNEAF